jgi:protein tyrosine phosphatase (PTP) superfamily phosphohydrolase (DUF442 family)
MTDTMTGTPPAKTSRKRRLVPALLIGAVLAAGAWVWRERFETYHLAPVQEGVLYRDGNRGVREFANAVEKVKPKTVVALVDDKELADPKKPMFAEELRYLQRQGVKVERIPVKLGGWPTSDQVKQFLELVQKPENQPVLVHCAQGVRRTGMMAAAYQQSVLKHDDQTAQSQVLMFGRDETSRSIIDLRKFIEAYDESTGELKTEFAQPSDADAAKVNWEKE